MVDHHTHAVRIRKAYEGTVIAPIRHAEPRATIDDAYVTQAINRDYWRAIGRRIVGTKIGLTSEAVQRQLGVDTPDFGILFADMRVGDANIVHAGRLLQPRVEAEIAFCLNRDITEANVEISTLMEAIQYAAPALEVVDSRISDWDINMIDTVADNASAGMFVLGSPTFDIRNIDLARCSMRMEKNGTLVSEGNGAACLGNPLNALRWLVLERALRGDPLKAGDIILSGALGPMIAANSGDSFHADIESIGSVDVYFA